MRIPSRLLTPRLELRPHRDSDIEAHASLFGDSQAAEVLGLAADQRTPESARQRLRQVIASYETADPSLCFAIWELLRDAYVGSCGLSPSTEKNTYAITYVLPPSEQRPGIANEALEVLIAFAFEDLLAERLVALPLEQDEPAVRVAQRLGFRRAGAPSHSGDGLRYELRRRFHRGATR